uniref:Proline-rich extensin-like protein EPR1 n=1 Tax=Sinocyclocheilus anshuiensis TaxID=1608454 RepID=A0A671KIY8_9TELE
MAFKEKPILTCCIFIWLTFIKISSFVIFNEEKRLDSAGSFDKNARTRESFDRGDQKPKSGAQVGRLLIWQDQASKSHGGGRVRFSSDFSSRSQPHENANQSDDSGWMKLQPLWEQVYGLNTRFTPTVERLLGMKPKVDCDGDLMKLTVHGREAPFGSNFLIDRGSIPPLPLAQLPSGCGHIFLRTWRDFVFVIPYNGCYVSQERDTFVLPLLWWGLPVKMSCSSLTSAESEPMVSCYSNGMIVRLHRGVSENLKIKVMNEWQPLLKVSARCGYSLVSHPEGVVIHAPYMPCTEPKDGVFTLSMAMESEFNLSCPALSLGLPMSAPDLAMGYNYGPLSSKRAVVPPASDYTATQYLVENPLIKDTDAPGTSKYMKGPTMWPYIFRKLESTAASPWSTMKPANVALVIHPLGPSKLHSRLLQNIPVAEPLAYSDQSPDPAVNQAEIQRYFSLWGHDTQPMLVAPNNNVPSFEKMVHHDISSKPTMPPTHGKNVFMNYWYQAANLNAKPPMSNSPTKDSLTQMPLPQPSNNHNPFEPSNQSPQPERSRGKNPPLQLNFHPFMQIHNSVPVMSPRLYFPPNGESMVPVFRSPKLFQTHWVPAVQSNKDASTAL